MKPIKSLRINARLGGTNSYADSPFTQAVLSKIGKYMVIGDFDLFVFSYYRADPV
jgi:hypothetical protein